MKRTRRAGLVAAVLAVVLVGTVACSGGSDEGSGTNDDDGSLTLYSGRSESLVGPLVEGIDLGVTVTPAYDKKAAQILEEGEHSPADLFFAQDAGELGVLAMAGLLEPLPADIVDRVPATYRSESGGWAATSARSRVLLYNPSRVPAADLPAGIDGLLDPRFRGQVGYAPTNPSFKSFVTGLRLIRGDDAARDWLTRFMANEPKAFDGNGPLVKAVDDGTIATGLTNHYYWVQEVAEKGIDAVASRLHFFADGDPGALVNVAGIAVLKSSPNKEQAVDFVRAMFTADNQKYFTTEVGEYAITGDIPIPVAGIPPLLTDLHPPTVDLDDLADVAGTERMLTEVGAV
ncbi:extracellular solute-binding protein [Gordonia sp. NPDC003376]